MSSKNNNPRGIVLILLAMLVFSVQDGIMKHIYSFVSLYEVYLIRTLVSFGLILIFLKLKKKRITRQKVKRGYWDLKTIFSFFTFKNIKISPKLTKVLIK